MNTPDKTPIDVPRHIVRNNKVPAKLGGQVLYVLSPSDSSSNHGRVRPATIVHLVDDGSVDGLVNIVVFTDVGDNLPPVQHARNVVHDEERYERRAGDEIFLEHRPGTWHWPPPRELVFEHVAVAQLPPSEDPQHDEHDELEVPPSDPDTGTIELASLKEPFPVAGPPAGFEKVAERDTASELPFSGPDSKP